MTLVVNQFCYCGPEGCTYDMPCEYVVDMDGVCPNGPAFSPCT
jgi:hypothetical protein